MIPLILIVAAAVLLARVGLELHLDTRRAWAAETETWHPSVAALPAPRADLTAELPLPVTPMDLPARWDTATVEAPSRLRDLVGRHRVGTAPGTEWQQARWNSPTGQFWLIVDALGDLDDPCSHCAAPEDGERPHVGCPGCACPCTPLPEGVEGHAIAGGTR